MADVKKYTKIVRSKLAGIKNIHRTPSKVSYGTLLNFIHRGHFALSIIAVGFMLLMPDIRKTIDEKPCVHTLCYFLFEIGHWFIIRCLLGHTNNFPVNYISLVFIRCFIFFNTKVNMSFGRLIYGYTNGDETYGAWNVEDGKLTVLLFLLTIPAIITFTKIYVDNYDVSCLIGTTLSTTSAIVILLTSISLEEFGPNGKKYHFLLSQIYLSVTVIMTFVNTLGLLQRAFKYSKKQIHPEKFGRSLIEIFIMYISTMLTLPYIKMIHPELGLKQMIANIDESVHIESLIGNYNLILSFVSAPLTALAGIWSALVQFIYFVYCTNPLLTFLLGDSPVCALF